MNFRHSFLLFSVFLFLSACGGGGGDNGGGGGTPPPDSGNCTGSGEVQIGGRITFEDVPPVESLGGYKLDYENPEANTKSVRGARVVAKCADGSVNFAETLTDDIGHYALTVPENVDVVLQVEASMRQTGAPSWDVTVRDNTSGNRLYALVSEEFNSETADILLNLHAASGWTGTAYDQARSAGPFAILDTAYQAMQKVLAEDPDAVFPPLQFFWSAQNRTCSGSVAEGCIGTSYYQQGSIYVLGDADNDTDEFDDHVIAHEWGHYFEDYFSRSDSIGGPHGANDILDIRVAFSEGWGNAFSAIVFDDPVYIDTFGNDQATGFSIEMENDADLRPWNAGWFSESSVQQIIWDIYDSTQDTGDNFAEGFAPIYKVLTLAQKNDPALTSLFPFVHGLLVQENLDELDMEILLNTQNIDPVTDSYGTNRSNLGPDPDAHPQVSPLYTDMQANGSVTTICSTNDYAGTAGSGSTIEYNRLAARRFLKFQVADSASYEIAADATASAVSENADPDFFLYENGVRILSAEATGKTDSGSTNLAAGKQYVLEVLDWQNVDDNPGGGDSCIDVTVTQQ